jgi:hypothetical protein
MMFVIKFAGGVILGAMTAKLVNRIHLGVLQDVIGVSAALLITALWIGLCSLVSP